MSRRKTLSAVRAIWIGMAWINGPVLALMFFPLVFFGALVSRGVVDRAHNWIGAPIFIAGIALAWLWWSFMVPRWRLWAFERVADIPRLKSDAVSYGLTWPDGHFFERTEIKSKAQAQREAELDPPYAIVPAELGDREFVRRISRQNMESYYTAQDLKWDSTAFDASWPTTENYAISRRGTTIGVLRLRPEPGAIYISDLQIAVQGQGRGAGTFALKSAERIARERGLPRIRLRAFTDNPAIRLYERAGFRKIADESGKLLFERVL